MKLTEEQLTKVWKWAGVTPEKCFENLDWYWKYPVLDLNNFFKYIEPKLPEFTLQRFGKGCYLGAADVYDENALCVKKIRENGVTAEEACYVAALKYIESKEAI